MEDKNLNKLLIKSNKPPPPVVSYCVLIAGFVVFAFAILTKLGPGCQVSNLSHEALVYERLYQTIFPTSLLTITEILLTKSD